MHLSFPAPGSARRRGPCQTVPGAAVSALAAAVWLGVLGVGFVALERPGLTAEWWRGFWLPLLVAPWTEQVLFRAGLQRAFRRHCSAAMAVGLVAMAFGATHLAVAALVLPAPGAVALLLAAATALPALAIGWVYERTGRLLPCMALHATMNLVMWQAQWPAIWPTIWPAVGAVS
jgi:membrane protease YdiL (CAAX protease family)